jgi:flagellar motor switch protein FliN/FliY
MRLVGTPPEAEKGNGAPPFDGLLDVVLPTTVVLGTSTITVRACLALAPNSVLKLDQTAGDDLWLEVNGVRLARGEVVIVDDSAVLRLTGFARSGKDGSV